jgi:glucosamine--fructose-6-phosphate aminotransferase (isomerizing)
MYHLSDELGREGSSANVMNLLLEKLHKAIGELSRPIDAIKHQAKTVTVGTSRLETPRFEGILFDTMLKAGVVREMVREHIAHRLRQLQPAIADILGYSYYEIAGLSATGQPTDQSTIHLIKREGVSLSMPSRSALSPVRLVGTKRAVVQKGSLFIGIGLGDKHPILIVPLFSPKSIISHQLLMHVNFADKIEAPQARGVLGDMYEDVRNMVTEANITWTDQLLTLLSPEFLCTHSVGEIVAEIESQKGKK